MGGTKIFVFQLRELIKTAVFAVIGIALIIALAYLFIPRERTQAEPNVRLDRYIPGTYTAQITLNNDPVDVVVTVSQNEILSIELKNMAEAQEVFYPLVRPTMTHLTNEIIKQQSLDIQTAEDSAVTGSVLLGAVREALAQAVPVV
jgi:uncharacterized protein with FMN-binding domain